MSSAALPSEQKMRGGYYTPYIISDYVTRWAIENEPEITVEPSCGDGSFVRAFTKHHREGHIIAHELTLAETEKVCDYLNESNHQNYEVHEGDYLSHAIMLMLEGEPVYDAAIGNPPFIRYQHLTPHFQRKTSAIFKRCGLTFTKHTNAWVPFIIACIELLKPNGRLGMVIPSEIIHVMHASSLRQYLYKQCSDIRIIDPKELWFPGTQQGTVILMTTKKASPSQICKGVSILHVKDNSFLAMHPNTLFKHTQPVKFRQNVEKWTHAILDKNELGLLNDLKQLPDVHKFGDIARIEVGIVTGANHFFLVDNETVEKYALHDVIKPMFGKSEQCSGMIFDDKQHTHNLDNNLPCHLVYLDKPIQAYQKSVQTYILSGEAQKLHTRFKCKIRHPWYQVPSMHVSPLVMWRRAHHHTKLIYNQHQAYVTDTAYRVTPIENVAPEHLVYCFPNPLTALSSELSGRYYGGGVLEVTPSEAKNIIVPLPDIPIDISQLNEHSRTEKTQDIVATHGVSILQSIGLEQGDIKSIQSALHKMMMRRMRKG